MIPIKDNEKSLALFFSFSVFVDTLFELIRTSEFIRSLELIRCSATYLPSHKQDILYTAGEVRMNSSVTFFYGLLQMDTPVLANQQELTYISSVWTHDAV